MEKANRKSIFLIDGYALLYRSYFVFIKNPLRTSKGENVSAIYGFLNSLLKIIKDHEPEYLCIVFDSKEPTFRHRVYPEYKATREKMPEDLHAQLPKVRTFVEAMHIPTIELPGYEADDIIGTLAVKARREGLDVVIVSGDKDFYQLVDEGIRLYDPRKAGKEDEWVDVGNAKDKFGVPPAQVRDVRALVGDTSDNIPGVSGIGPKTAIQLISEHGSLEGVYDNLGKIGSASLRGKLEKNRESAFFSRELVTIEVALPIEVPVEELVRGEPDEQKLFDLLDGLELHSLKSRVLTKPEIRERGPGAASYSVIEKIEELAELARELESRGMFSFDLETDDLDPMRARIVGISLAPEPGRACYVPVAHEIGNNLDLGEVLAVMGPLLGSETVRKIGHDIKYETAVLLNAGVRLAGVAFDTMVAAYLLDPERNSYSLSSLASAYLDQRIATKDELTGTGKGRIPFWKVPVTLAGDYSCEEPDCALRLARVLEAELTQKELYDLFQRVELPLIDVLAEMECTGVAIDVPFFEKLAGKIEEVMDVLEREIHEMAGGEFNLNSTRQLSEILFGRMHLPVVKKTKTGYSTDNEVLEVLATKHGIAEKLIEYRELAKLLSTYVEALPLEINPATGKVHTSFNQVATATGRLSSSDPNLQNIPIRTEVGRAIRKGFVPSGPDRSLLSADYSQIELRIVAHASKDENMIQAFTFGADIHRQTAALVFGLAQEDVTPHLRSKAKAINFGVIYGMGPYGLSKRLAISMEDARIFIANYFERYHGVREFIDRTVADAKEKGYVTTLLGRRRYLPQITSRNRTLRDLAIRTAINSPIQGTAADLIKIAMVAIAKEIRRSGIDAKMIIQVHDELVFDVADRAVKELGKLVKEKMERAIDLVVPVTVDVGVGKDWFSAKK